MGTTADGKAYLTDAAMTYLDPVTGKHSGFDPRMNTAPYSVLILTGAAKGTTMDVESVSGATVIFKTDGRAGSRLRSGTPTTMHR